MHLIQTRFLNFPAFSLENHFFLFIISFGGSIDLFLNQTGNNKN